MKTYQLVAGGRTSVNNLPTIGLNNYHLLYYRLYTQINPYYCFHSDKYDQNLITYYLCQNELHQQEKLLARSIQIPEVV